MNDIRVTISCFWIGGLCSLFISTIAINLFSTYIEIEYLVIIALIIGLILLQSYQNLINGTWTLPELPKRKKSHLSVEMRELGLSEKDCVRLEKAITNIRFSSVMRLSNKRRKVIERNREYIVYKLSIIYEAFTFTLTFSEESPILTIQKK